MESEITRLFDLIENHSFESLSKADQSFVLSHMSSEEYNMQRAIIASTSELKTSHVVPAPLVLPTPKQVGILNNLLLYRGLLAVACLVIAWLIFRPQPTQKTGTPIARQDSSSTNATAVIYVHDTVVQHIPTIETIEHIVHDTISIIQLVTNTQREERLLEAGAINYPSLSKSVLENTGLAINSDRTRDLLPKILPLGN